MHMESPYVDGTKFGLNFRTPMNITLEGDFDLRHLRSSRALPADQGAEGATRCLGMLQLGYHQLGWKKTYIVG